MRWFKQDIINGYKMIENKKILLKDSIKNNDKNILHYLFKFENHYVPIDIGLNKGIKSDYNTDIYKLPYIKQEHYYILADIKRKFYKDKDIYENIVYVLENIFGCYKQIIMDVFYFGNSRKYQLINNTNLNKYEKNILHKIKICTNLNLNKK